MKGLLMTAQSWFRDRLPLLVAPFLTAILITVGFGPLPASADDNTITVTGRGWGHGRGMGQYGAYGYAENFGWTAAQILDHYYGGTTGGQAPAGGPVDPAQIRVDLRFMRGRSTAVALGQGSIHLRGADEADLGQVDAGAVRLRWVGGGFEVETASSCAGPWSSHSFIGGRSTVRLLGASSATGSDAHLQACGLSYRVWYEGELRAVVHNGFPLTVNVVSIDQYLRGVVPNEVPASWPAAVLEAQAVAARSYALAGDTRQQPYADSCDTARCQVYDGVYTQRRGFRASTNPRTDAAIAATAGVVRLNPTGTIARTEFSSSTGGHTVDGEFDAVADLGDAIAANPNHEWSTAVSKSTIENRYGLGRLSSAEVTERNGLGADGGRASAVRFTFDRGVVVETGDKVRSFLGLKSDWFSFGGGSGAELRETDDGRYVDWVYQELGGRPATTSELVYWVETVGDGDPSPLTEQLARDRYFAGRMVDELYVEALGRPSDGLGRNYWLERIEDGVQLDTIGASLFGSEEYYRRAGGSDVAFLDALYADVLGRSADESGRRYWADRLVEDGVPIHHVAAGFYNSRESRLARSQRIHQRLLGDRASVAITTALAERLLAVDDLDLAAEIAVEARTKRF